MFNKELLIDIERERRVVKIKIVCFFFELFEIALTKQADSGDFCINKLKTHIN